MPSFSRIQREIREQEVPDTQYDLIRRRYLKKLSAKTGRNTILYYSGWLQKPARYVTPLMSISDGDKNGFMSAVHGLDVSRGLDIVLHTPGGDIAATESLIDYLNQKFQGDMRQAVQLHKESAGLQNKRGSRVDTAKAKTAGSTRPKLPAGPGFMPRMGMKKLERLIRSTKESVERARLQAAWMRKMGMSIREIAGRLFKSYSTVRDWLVKMRRRGPRGRFNKRRGRRKRILNKQSSKR